MDGFKNVIFCAYLISNYVIKYKETRLLIVIFVKVIIFVRGCHCGYLSRGVKKTWLPH